ncbi:MAG: dUTP diphosphatase [Fusobacterium sp.]
MVKVKVIKETGVQLPKYESKGAAGLDVRANIVEPITLKSLERKLIPTGLKVSIPEGYEIQVRPRSGMALKHGITMLNTPGTIDSDYRGDIGLIVANLSNEEYTIQPQERLGQLVLNKIEQIEWEVVETLDVTERGAGGFGSTGK